MDLTKPSTAHLVDLSCHCPADPAGHRLDHPGCAVVIRPGRYTRPEVTFGSYSRASRGAPAGTCTECRRGGVKLVAVVVRTAQHGHDLMPGIPLGRLVELAPHARPGKGAPACPGRTVAETRFRHPEVDAMVRDYGPASVTR